MSAEARRTAGRWVVVLVSVLGWSGAAAAQIGAGRMTGTVRDTSGAGVPGATVTVTAEATNTPRTVVSDADGAYTVPGLPPGRYRVRFELIGFRPVARSGVTVATGDVVRVDVELTVSSLSEAITVVADASLLRGETGGLGQVIDNQKVVQLPLNGRTFITLAGLVPGVALPPNSLLPRINGGRPRTNEYLFDGISVLQPEPGQIAYYPVVDAIQEFKIETNSPPAEFGRFNGGVVNLTTKSGTNAVHGTGFEFLRHESLNAANYFQAANTTKPQYRRNQFGGVIGGPIQRDRTFFFADYQGQRQRIARTVTSTVPTLLQRRGIFTETIAGRTPAIYDPASAATQAGRTPFPGGQIPEDRWDPVAKALMARYPEPTSGGTANNYSRIGSETIDQDQFTLRVDHRFATNRDQAFARFARFTESFGPAMPLPDGSGAATGTLGPQDTRSSSFASNYTHVFSSTVMHELRFGDTRRGVQRTAASLVGTASAALGVPGIPTNAHFPDTLPTFSFGTAYQQLGSPANTASDFSTSVTEVADSLTWLKGRHSVKLGADLRWARLDVIQPPQPTGLFTFSALFTDNGSADTGNAFASFLLGQVERFSIDLQQQAIRNRAHFQEYFIQDDWRVTDWFSMNAGVRYTLNFPSYEVNDQVAVFNFTTARLDYLGQNGNPRTARELKKNNIGPRLGLVARLTDRTVARTGYGLVWIEMAGITTPFTTPSFPYLQTVSQRTLDNSTPAFQLRSGPSVAPVALTPEAGLGQGVFGVDRDLGSGYVQQWNASLQREISANVIVEGAYVGSFITHVGIPDVNLNQLTREQLALGSALTTRVPNPYFGRIPRSSSLGDPTIPAGQLMRPYPEYTSVSLYRNNVGTTEYHGFTAKVEQRLSNGFSYLVAYTRSKLVDDASSVFDASILTGPVANYPVADSFDRSLERDDSTGDIPHILAVSSVWQPPFGRGRGRQLGGIVGALANEWTITGLLNLQSGVPLAVIQATNNNAFAGFGVQRPNLVGDPTLPADQRSPARWFNTAAFQAVPQFQIGNASRNPVRGPGYMSLDLAFMKSVPAGGTRAVELRAEIFNALNHNNFGAPNVSVGSAAFGTITTALDPRVIQLAVKFLF